MKPYLLTFLLLISGCKTMPEKKSANTPVAATPQKGLAPQELAEGECGMFLWSATSPRTFAFFQKQNVNVASFYHRDRKITLRTSQVTAGLGDLAIFDFTYSGTAGENIRIKGNFAEDIEGGRRISNSRITVNDSENWQEIIPVSGVFACR